MELNNTNYNVEICSKAGRSKLVDRKLRKNGGLEEAVCGFDDFKGLPKHSKEVPAEAKGVLPDFYCFDSRRDECTYSTKLQGKPFCTYK